MKSNDISLFLDEIGNFYSDDIRTNKLIRELSTGNKNKVGILSAILWSPELLILDEPFANLDPSSQVWLKNCLKVLNEKGTTVILPET